MANKVLKIWGRINSINVQKVVWIADELGIPYERVDAGRQFGFPSHYSSINPFGLIPAIEDDGFVLFESNTIVRYLAVKHSQKLQLLSDSLQKRFEAEKWMDWVATGLATPMTTLFLQTIRTPVENRDANAIEAARVESEKKFLVVEEILGKSPYVLGNELSVADIAFGCFVHRWLLLPITRPHVPNLEAYYQRLKSREPYQKNVAAQPLT